ncbi:MAG TPA: carboxypeptidase-like regulatory domain-containing protein, partial [Bryobacteraceae bacterium]|nr:carboxypeptidase-like regulatory domain-containing protein [Bryobacteraceae bacterium]
MAPVRADVTASISGHVEDSSGASVSGATVTVKSLDTGAVRTTTTGDSGDYRISALPLGRQEVKIEKRGFESVVREGITLVVGQEGVVNVSMTLGEFSQQVTVTEAIPLVNTTTASVAGLVGERDVKELPLNGRSFDDLITLNPGAINYSAMKSANTSTSDGNTFTVAGRRPGDNLFLLNGIEYTGSSQLAVTPGGVSGYLLGIDAVREFNVLTDTYPAEYGKRSGAQVNVVTQSGSNQLHGTLFEFLRNSALDGRNFFNQNFVPPFRQNQFGGSLGGPLKKNKLFLFGNYEGYRQSLAISSVSVVPDAQARLGFLPNASGVETKVTNLNTNILQYMQLWPQPNGPELLANGIASGTALSYNNPKQSIREDFGTMRTDYMLGAHDTMSAAYTVDDGNSLVPLADPLFASYTALRMQVASVEETHVFSPTILNTFRAGFSRAGFALESSLLASFPSSLSFVSGGGPGGIVVGGGTTTTGLAAITSAGPNNAAGVWNRRNLFTYNDDVQITRGRHTLSFGAWFQRIQDNEDTASRQLGVATFTSLTTMLQGTVSTFQVVPAPNELGWRSLFGAWYFTDTFKITPSLTLEAGIRHEFTTGWNEVSGRAANYLTDSNGVLVTTPRVAGSAFTDNKATRLFGPRVGIAWDVFGNGKTAIRSGFGTYYSLIEALSFQLNSVAPYNGSVSYSNVALPSVLPVFPGASPPPSCGPGVPQPCTTFAPVGVQPDARTPTVEEWNFRVEQQLDRNTVARLGYVGSHGYHGLLSVDPNSIPAAVCASASGCTAGGTPGTTKTTVPQGAQYIPVAGRPNPYLAAGFFWYTEGNSSYNALQVDVTHRLSNGFEVRGNYTWSKNLDMNSGLTGAQSQNQAQMIMDRNNVLRDWGPAALNITHQASLSGLYALPFGHGKRWLASAGPAEKLVGGWQLNTIVTLLSGFPFTPLVGSNRSGDGDTRNPDRPSLNPAFSGQVITGNPSQWYNPNAFTLPAAGTWGTLGRGVYTGPGLADVDLSVFKTTALRERASLQFRAEFFNAINHTNFGLPNTTVFSGTSINASAGLITATATNSRQIQF